MRITENRKNTFQSTGIFIHPKHWNKDKEKVRRSHSRYKALNQILERKLDKARGIEAELGRYDKDSAKAIAKRLKKQFSGDFFDLAQTYLDEVEATKSFYTYKNAKVAINKLKAFEGSKLPLKHIDAAYLERFETFLKVEYENKAGTIDKNFRTIKNIIRKALKQKLITVNPLIEFDGAKKPKRSNKTKLTIKQIHAIEELELEKGSNLWHTRNYFMFSFYSGGIRFGDLCGLKWKDVKENRLSYRMNKYDKPFSVELNEPQRDILKYYMGGEYIFNLLNEHKQYSPETLRKAISKQNAKVNKWLKKIAELAGIEETVSFHVSRHSFAQYAVNKGLSMYELMQTLRHSSLKTTQQYLKGLDEQLADKAMKKVF